MLEGILSKYLAKFVGDYVENIDKEQLKLGILRENLELKNLVLKKTALDGLDLPFAVTAGFLDKLIIKIPWTRIQSKPVEANITDLFLVVQPKKCRQWVEQHEKDSRLESKKRRLNNYETMREHKKQAEDEEAKEKSKDTFFTKLAEKIVHNLQISVKTIHIRYEDTSDPDRPIIIGASFEEADFKSTNESWVPTFVSDVENSQFMYKSATLSEFSVYINHNDRLLLSDTQKYSPEKIFKLMKEMVFQDTNKTFILHPVSGRAYITIQREGKISFDLPRMKLDVEFDDVSITLNDIQYKSVLECVEYITQFDKFERFRRFKPNERPSTNASKEKWWKYVYESSRLNIDSQFFTWDQVMEKITYKDKYIPLYKRSKEVPWHKPLEKADIKAMSRIEEMLDVEDIIYFREIANEELALEGKAHSEYVEKKKEKKGWLSWIRGDKTSYSEAAAEAAKISDEQKEWLKQQIAYKEDEVSQSYKAPPEFVLVDVNVTLKWGTLQLVGASGREMQTIIEGIYRNLTGRFKLRQKAHELSVRLGNFEVLDKFTKDTKFPKIAVKATSGSGEAKHLAALDVFVNPLSNNSDIKVDLKLARLDMVCNIELVQRVLGFFSKPTDVNLSSIQKATISKLTSVGNQARAQLAIALKTKKFIDLDIVLDAPTILFPEHPSSDTTPIVIVDLGQFFVKSISDKKEREARLQRGEAPKEDDFYDIFNIQLNDFYVLFTDYPTWSNRLETGQIEGTSLLDRVNMNFSAKHSFMPLSNERPKTLVTGLIPSVNLNFSPSKMEKLMFVVNGVLQLADDPFGKAARHNRIAEGLVNVRGKIKGRDNSDSNEKYWVEVNQSSYIHFFVDESDQKPITSLKLDKYVEASLLDEDIILTIPQLDSKEEIALRIPEKSARLEWLGKIKMLIQNAIELDTFSLRFLGEENEDEEGSGDSSQSDAIVARVDVKLSEFNLKLSIDTPQEERRLSNITLSDLNVSVSKRTYDLGVDVSLSNFNVSDLFEGTTTDFIVKKSSSKQVANFRFVSVQEGSPIYQLQKADSHIDVRFKDLDIYFDQLTLSQFVLFGNRIQSIFENLQSRRRFIEAKYVKDSALDIYNQARLAKQNRSGMSILIQLEQLHVQLIDYGVTFSKVEVDNTTVDIFNNPIETLVQGSLKNLKIIDNSSSTETSYKKIFGLDDVEEKDSSLISFQFRGKKTSISNEKPEYDKELKLRMKSIRFIFLRRFFTKLQVYFVNGPLMGVLSTGGKKAAKLSVEAVKKQSQNIKMIKMDIVVEQPSIIVPKSCKSSDKLLATFSEFTLSNHLIENGPQFTEVFDIGVRDMGMQTINDLINLSTVVDKTSLKVSFQRAIVNPKHEIPDFNIDAILEPVHIKLSHQQYKMIFEILNDNIKDTAGLTNATEVEAKKLAQYQSKANILSGESKTSDEVEEDSMSVKVNFLFPKMDLTLLKNNGCDLRRDDLTTLNMDGLHVDFGMKSSGAITAHITMDAISAVDNRHESTSCFKEYISSQGSDLISDGPMKILEVVVHKIKNNIMVDANLGTPTFIFVPDVALEIKNFFMDRGDSNDTTQAISTTLKPSVEFSDGGDIELFEDVTLTKDLILDSTRKLYIRNNSTGLVNINGNGFSLVFDVSSAEPLLLIDPGMKVQFQKILIKYFVPDEDVPKLIACDHSTSIIMRPTEGVSQKFLFVEDREIHSPSTLYVDENAKAEEALQNRIKVNGSFKRPKIIFPEDPSQPNTKHLCIHTSMVLAYESDPYQKLKEQGKFYIQGLCAFYQSSTTSEYSANIIEPLDICVNLITPNELPLSRQVEILLERDIGVRISYNDVQLVKRIVDKFQQANLTEDVREKASTAEKTVTEDFEEEDNDFSSIGSDNEEPEDFVDVNDEEGPVAIVEVSPTTSESEYGEELEDAPIEIQEDNNEKVVEVKEDSKLTVTFISERELSVMIVDDIQGFDIPLVNFFLTKPSFRGEISFGNQMLVQLLLSIQVNANFYNVKIASWEPILEKWSCKVRFSRVPNINNSVVPYTNELTVTSGSDTDVKLVNINVTQSMLETLLTTGKLWRDEFSKGPTGGVSKKFFPYTIKNHSGFVAHITHFNSMGEATHFSDLDSGSQIGFSLGEITAHSISKHQVELKIADFPTRIINLKKVGTVAIPHKSSNKVLWIENRLVQGRKILSLRSNMRIHNNTTIPWEFGVETPHGIEIIGEILPDDYMGVPLNAVENGILKIRPSELKEEFEWSISGQFSFATIITHNDKSRLLTCPPTSPKNNDTYYAVLRVCEEKIRSGNSSFIGFTIELKPPLLIENLLPRTVRYTVKESYNKDDALTAKKKDVNTGILNRGEQTVVYTANLKRNIFLRTEFLEEGWGKKRIAFIHSINETAYPKNRTCMIEDENKLILTLCFDYNTDPNSSNAFVHVSVYVPYWIVNHTSIPISIYEQSDNPKSPHSMVAGFSALQKNVDSNIPLMFSFSSQLGSTQKIAVGIKDVVSQYFGLGTTAGVANGLSIKGEKKQYDIGYHISIAPGKYRKIKVVTISSQYVIANKTKRTIQIAQLGCDEYETLEPEQKINYFWPNKDGPKKIRVLMKDTEFNWSPPFEFQNTTRDISLKFLHKEEPYKISPYVLSANTVMDRATLYLSITEPKYPPFKFDNRLNFDVMISQSGLQRVIWWPMQAKKRTWYSWDDLSNNSQTIDIRVNNTTILHKFNPGKVTDRPKVIKLKEQIHGLSNIFLSVIPNGPMFRIVFSEIPEQKVATNETTKIRFATRLPQIGISCISKKSQEIAYVSLKEISMQYETTDVNEYIQGSIKKLQIDNQSAEDVGIPVVLHHPSVEGKRNFLSVSSSRSLTEESILLFHYASIALQQFNLSLESNFVVSLIEFFSEMSFQKDDYDENTTEKMLDFTPNLPSPESGKPLYFNLLQLHPISFFLTFNFTKMDISFFRKNFFMQLIESAGLTLINCSDARIKLNALHIESRSFSSTSTLKDAIIKHYKSKILGELPKIVGSMDIIGNPLGLITDVSFGARDFFYEPIKAIVFRPEDYGVIRSFEKGTTSLVNHTLHGGFATASKLTSSLGKGLSALTFDEEYLQSREKSRKPVGLFEGVADGGEAFKKGIVEGATGLVTKPLEGLEKEGGRGLMKGIAKGVLGAPVKPVAGLLDFATKTAEGVSNSSREIPTRERNIRTFGDDGRVVAYNQSNAYCQMILHYTDCKGQTHRAYVFSQDETKIYIVTDTVVLCAQISDKSLEWKYDLSTVSEVSYLPEKSQVIIQGKTKGKSGLFSSSKAFSKIIQNNMDVESIKQFYVVLSHLQKENKKA